MNSCLLKRLFKNRSRIKTNFSFESSQDLKIFSFLNALSSCSMTLTHHSLASSALILRANASHILRVTKRSAEHLVSSENEGACDRLHRSFLQLNA